MRAMPHATPRHIRVILLGCSLLACVGLAADEKRERSAPTRRPPAAEEGGVAVYFTPNGGALSAIVSRINGARKSLDVQAYLLTTQEIAGPIAKAHARGVKVRVVMDSDNAGDQYSAATYLANAGVDVRLDGEHKEAHNKVMLVDGKTIVTGSFNFTRAAEESNAENLLVISDKPRLYAAYLKNFETHRTHAKPYAKTAGMKTPKTK
jgi:phosphatidylserine/phosphatidylglycerophosphate/cardiolipin synthase-like enzyme